MLNILQPLSLLPVRDLITAAAYIVLAYYFWHTRRHPPKNALDNQSMTIWERTAIGAALFSHALSLENGLFSRGLMHFSFSLALSLMLWLACLIYWLAGFRTRTDGLQPIVLPIAALGIILPHVFPLTHAIAHTNIWAFRLHFLSAMFAYSLLTLSALHAIVIAGMERQLHQHKPLNYFSNLPPILSMENLLFRMLSIGFVLLSIALATGAGYAEFIFGQALRFDHKTIFALISWCIFAALLLGRYFLGWRGRTALRWTMAGFMTLLLAYIGTRFVLEILLMRS